MRALMKTKAGPGALLVEVPEPPVGPQEVKVKIKTSSICGTDVHIFQWDPWAQFRIKPPLIFGHECSGEVIEVGNRVKKISLGDHVSLETHIWCGKCSQCKRGLQHICKSSQIIGVDRPGIFTEYVVVPEQNAWKNDPTLDWEVGSILEPFGNAVHAIQAVCPLEGKTVLVSGCGPIGIMAVGVAKAMGASQVFATDLNEYRLKLAKKMKATHVVQIGKEKMKDFVLEHTQGEGVDVLVEMSGSRQALEEGFQILKSGGEASLLGLPSSSVPLDFSNQVIFKGITIHGITGRKIFETWEKGKELLTSKALDLKAVITHSFPLEEFAQGMALMESGQCGKITLTL